MALRAEAGWREGRAQSWGSERWNALHQALHRGVEHVCVLNPFLTPEVQTILERDYKLQSTSIPGAFTFDVPEESSFRHFRAIEDGPTGSVFVESEGSEIIEDMPKRSPSPFFFCDGATVIASLAVRPEPGDSILCTSAAPGCMPLLMASVMFANRCRSDVDSIDMRGRLVCNEFAKEPAHKLQRVLRDFLPPLLFDANRAHGPHIVFTSADPATSHNTMEKYGPYDRIVVDAPCTSDRQLLRDPSLMDRWSLGSEKVSAARQLKLLYSALWSLKEGGVLVYCTTSLSSEECDGVVEKLLLKVRGSFILEVLPVEEEICRMVPGLAAQPSDWGVYVLPDTTPFGPVYFSRLQLVKRTHEASHLVFAQ
eukprot:gnl/TRDRNA2_/TRDRNA2_189050_c0_seq1.p1 gnl/TRDRNA2_/TRDRNA2_189050_c0~~gnl/TRDRNA2_/TRDRNA2_189050_c0_seq1.p1  ORF type:complete len:367 (-),score=63.68 gnl/TRDRNA2_/TRDRNA2_189050_c0_seq1:45-1145(-)